MTPVRIQPSNRSMRNNPFWSRDLFLREQLSTGSTTAATPVTQGERETSSGSLGAANAEGSYRVPALSTLPIGFKGYTQPASSVTADFQTHSYRAEDPKLSAVSTNPFRVGSTSTLSQAYSNTSLSLQIGTAKPAIAPKPIIPKSSVETGHQQVQPEPGVSAPTPTPPPPPPPPTALPPPPATQLNCSVTNMPSRSGHPGPGAAPGRANLLDEIRSRGGFTGAGLNRVASTAPGSINDDRGSADRMEMIDVMRQALAVIQRANHLSDDEDDDVDEDDNGDDVSSDESWSC